MYISLQHTNNNLAMENENNAIVIATTTEQLRKVLLDVISTNKAGTDFDISEKISRTQAAKLCGVSYLTFSKWVKAGRVKEHGFSGNKFFLKKEVVQALKGA
jgi:excisionase family DNA binding protein